MGGRPPRSVHVQQLTRQTFAPYGDVIEAPPPSASAASGDVANQGTARRFNFLARLVNMRAQAAVDAPSTTHGSPAVLPPSLTSPPARANLCVFRVTPADLPFRIRLLERHKYSSQMFIPMTLQSSQLASQPPSYFVIVALNDPATQQPDWTTLAVFIATSVQAFNYAPGVWHHPMVGLGSTIDFVCLVWERREHQSDPNEDTEEVFLSRDQAIAVEWPSTPKL
ncbi:ureidoglycolate hydrolase [Entophlyctis helioformis]|nr:ureidoglycolate hydrolase [Entophlyctis helioformis]